MSKRQARIGGGIFGGVGLFVCWLVVFVLGWGKGILAGLILWCSSKKKRLESEHLNEDVRWDGFSFWWGRFWRWRRQRAVLWH
jgi:hypothetical protein